MVKVSIIIPIYNVEKYLKECLNSVVHQTLQELEIICIDDGSTDNSLDILNYFSNIDRRIKIIKLERNQGQAFARNRGLEIAEGKYVYFLDADDMIEKNAVEILTEEAEEHKLDVIFFDGKIIYENEQLQSRFKDYKTMRRGKYESIKTGEQLFGDFINNSEWSCSVPRQFWNRCFLAEKKIFFYEGIVHEDELFSFVAVLQAERAAYIKEAFFYRRFRENSTMTSKISAKNFCGYFTAYYFMNQFAYKENFHTAEIQCFLARSYGNMVRLYMQLKDEYNLVEELQIKQLREIFYFFCSVQNEYMAYGNISSKLLQKIEHYRNIYIYGAGIVGQSVYDGLARRGIIIRGFLVTCRSKEIVGVRGQPVMGIDEIEFDKENSIIIIAANRENQNEIISQLQVRDLNYICFNTV